MSVVCCNQISMDSYTDIEIECHDTVEPKIPYVTITIHGDMRPQKYMVEIKSDNKIIVSEWIHIESEQPEPIYLKKLNPGTHILAIRIGINAGGEPWYIHEEKMNITYTERY